MFLVKKFIKKKINIIKLPEKSGINYIVLGNFWLERLKNFKKKNKKFRGATLCAMLCFFGINSTTFCGPLFWGPKTTPFWKKISSLETRFKGLWIFFLSYLKILSITIFKFLLKSRICWFQEKGVHLYPPFGTTTWCTYPNKRIKEPSGNFL